MQFYVHLDQKSMMYKSLFASCLILIAALASAQHIKRRAYIGASFSSPRPTAVGAVLRTQSNNSPFARAGLQPNDRILRLNGELLNEANRWSDIVYNFREGDVVVLQVQRGSEILLKQVSFGPMPREEYPDHTVEYGEAMSSYGDLIRNITTYPKRSRGKLPALFVVGGLSCSSIEAFPGRPETGWTRVLQDISTNTGMVVMRVEKPGVGDSNGNCGESDFHRDIAAFKASYQQLKRHAMADSTNIIIYGSSMGSALAPYLANELGAQGIISDGTFVKTWFEHMLEIDRRIRLFQGQTPAEVGRIVNEGLIPLYYGMLIEKKSFAEVIREKPELAQYNIHSSEHMYGRPVAYYHQVQDFDFAGAWQKLKVPVRIIRGTNDWIMSDLDNDMIIDILESTGHQDHVLLRYEGLDHWNNIHEKPKDSFERKPGKWEDRISGVIIQYARELAGLE